MNALRRILKDRVAGAGALAIIVQLLLIQALVTSFNCATMSTAFATGGGFTICHGAAAIEDADATPSSHRGGSGGICLDCPCGVCSASGPTIFAGLAPNRDLGPANRLFDAAPDDHPVVAETVPAPLPRALKPYSTAPPLVFV